MISLNNCLFIYAGCEPFAIVYCVRFDRSEIWTTKLTHMRES